jgi:hypothetical protein
MKYYFSVALDLAIDKIFPRIDYFSILLNPDHHTGTTSIDLVLLEDEDFQNQLLNELIDHL